MCFLFHSNFTCSDVEDFEHRILPMIFFVKGATFDGGNICDTDVCSMR